MSRQGNRKEKRSELLQIISTIATIVGAIVGLISLFKK
nr:MAG TPA: Picornaviridae P3A protein [Caudoviricetes sp.]